MTKETYIDLALEILEAAHGCDMGGTASLQFRLLKEEMS
jgi:hypothetical protein